jgi:hypothetical protein
MMRLEELQLLASLQTPPVEWGGLDALGGALEGAIAIALRSAISISAQIAMYLSGRIAKVEAEGRVTVHRAQAGVL